MKRNVPILSCAVCLAALMALMVGCESSRISLTKNGVVKLEPRAEGKVRIAWSDAYTDAEGFTVTGVVRREDTTGGPIPVSVQVTVLAPDGSTWGEAVSHELYVPRRMVSRAQGFERFRVHFPGLPPEGSSIRIVPCGRPRSGPRVFAYGGGDWLRAQ
jgi:hypothetical protein